jgi:DNA-directed RNA polymerase specialized sigma24 family protein
VDADLPVLLAKHRPWLRGLASRLLRSCASDVVQDVLLDALKCPAHVRNGTDEAKRSWLQSLLTCKVHHALRDIGREWQLNGLLSDFGVP